MRKIVRSLLVISLALLVLAVAWAVLSSPKAYADYYNYPCTYPFVGTSADVDVLVHGGGQYCDGPTEINGTHYHCESGGGGIGGGAIALAPIGGLTLGGFGGSGIGGNLGDCHYVCPDLFRPLDGFPNPPAAWVKPLTVTPANNVCRDHMAPAGPDGAPVPPSEVAPAAPGGKLPPGATDAKSPPGLIQPGPPIEVPDIPSPLTPGGPLPLP